jgi:hypothetical protein
MMNQSFGACHFAPINFSYRLTVQGQRRQGFLRRLLHREMRPRNTEYRGLSPMIPCRAGVHEGLE